MSTVEVLLSHDNALINKDDSDDERGDGFLKTGSRYGGLPRPRSECCFPRMEILAPSPEPGKPAVLSPSQTMSSLHRASIVSTLAPFHPPCAPVSPAGLTLSVTPATPAAPVPPPIPKVTTGLAPQEHSLSQGSTPLPSHSGASGTLLGLGPVKTPAASATTVAAGQGSNNAANAAKLNSGLTPAVHSSATAGNATSNMKSLLSTNVKPSSTMSTNGVGLDKDAGKCTQTAAGGGAGGQVSNRDLSQGSQQAATAVKDINKDSSLPKDKKQTLGVSGASSKPDTGSNSSKISKDPVNVGGSHSGVSSTGTGQGYAVGKDLPIPGKDVSYHKEATAGDSGSASRAATASKVSATIPKAVDSASTGTASTIGRDPKPKDGPGKSKESKATTGVASVASSKSSR